MKYKIKSYFIALLSATLFTIAPITGLAIADDKIKPEHLKQARKAISALHATDQFDNYLPSASRELRMQLTSKDPNYSKIIEQTVDEQAIALAKRRANLEREAAKVYARYFTIDELKKITAFYNSSVGKKLLQEGPNTIKDMIGVFRLWSRDVSAELSGNVSKALAAKIQKQKDKK